jgi:poly-gamma-glutamate capsule biosynthesis protein CapA/YwtB (metallophosphatase superfamily)
MRAPLLVGAAGLLLLACSPDGGSGTPGPTVTLPRTSATTSSTPAASATSTATTSTSAPPETPPSRVLLTVVDEDGASIDQARLTLVGQAERPSSDPLLVNQPVAGVITADGYLSEPVVVHPGQQSVTVRLWRRAGADGAERVALHFAGDTMLGRRYQARDGRVDTPLVLNDADARSVVSDVAPLMAAADASMVNLETVVGELPADDAYPGKRFLLQSPPSVLAALDEMGIDLVALGNNHANDWQDSGVATTLESLDAAGLAHVGAGLSEADARRGRSITAGSLQVGVVSATTVDGDFVNDNLPAAGDEAPADLPAADRWQYVERPFRFGNVGDANYVAPAARRPGELWRLFVDREPFLSAEQASELWLAMTAPDVAPELQDWVARRGHGGAAAFDREAVAAEIARLRAEGAGLVVVQIHGGFQFSDVPNQFLANTTRAAVDAGADLVIAHHPHVLQGFEWYRDRLIAYSLGNFVFDQDFLSTFSSVIVRTVHENGRLLEARAVPIVIDRYRPVPAAGAGAAEVLGLLDNRSAMPAVSDRNDDNQIVSVLDRSRGATAAVDVDSGVITRVRPLRTEAVRADAGGFAALPVCSVAEVTSDPEWIGVDVLRWGSFDDVTADRKRSGTLHWQMGRGVTSVALDDGWALRFAPSARNAATARPVARAPVPRHRLFDSGGRPLDGEARYTLRINGSLKGSVLPVVRIATYDVRDTDPTVEPESLDLVETTVVVAGLDGTQRTVTIDITEAIVGLVDGVRADTVLVYLELPEGGGELLVNQVELYEWRSFDPGVRGVLLPADAVMGEPDREYEVNVGGCAALAP